MCCHYTTNTINTPARTRTWNTSLEARYDRPFHHQGRFAEMPIAIDFAKSPWIVLVPCVSPLDEAASPRDGGSGFRRAWG
jgi:hypothetical protein